MKYLIFATFAVSAAILAGCGNGEDAPAAPEQPAPVITQPADAPTPDPNPKYIGVPTTTETRGGGAVASGNRLRDVSFRVNSDVRVEVFVTATTTPLHVQLLDGRGTVLAEVDAPTGQEVRLEGAPNEGEPHNRIRMMRERPYGDNAPFTFRVKTLPAN